MIRLWRQPGGTAGLVSFTWGTEDWCVHLFVRRRHWVFGREETYERCTSWGLGPLLLVCLTW